MKNLYLNELSKMASSADEIIVYKDDSILNKTADEPATFLIDALNHHVSLENTAIIIRNLTQSAAILLILNRVKEVYALNIAQKAIQELQTAEIIYKYVNAEKIIMNKAGTDLDYYDKNIIASQSHQESYEKLCKALAAKRLNELLRDNPRLLSPGIITQNGNTVRSSYYDSYLAENRKLPRRKDPVIILDEFGMPLKITHLKDVVITPVANIDEELASKEAANLKEWKEKFLPLYYQEAKSLGINPNEDIWIVFEIFA